MNTKVENQSWSVAQAAAFLGVSPLTVRRAIDDRRIESFRVGRRVMLRPEAVREFVERNTTKAR